MAQYINKSAIVEEIEKRLSLLEGGTGDPEVLKRVEGVIKGYKSILSFLDTLEVKEEEEQTISEDLEYAALLHYPKMSRISEPHGFIPADNKSHYLGDANEDNRKAFIVGAQWQKQQNAPETKEVNLEKELERLDSLLYDLDGIAIAGTTSYLTVEDVKYIVKRFFELGLKAQKNYDGKAMLHVLEKGVKQGRRELIDKACEWLKDNWRKHVWLDGDNIIHFGLWENDFRKAMEE